MDFKKNLMTAHDLVAAAEDLLALARQGDKAVPAEVSRCHEEAEVILRLLGEGLGVVVLPIAVFTPNAEVLCTKCLGGRQSPRDVGPWSHVECDRCGARCRIEREDVARLWRLRQELAGRLLPPGVQTRLQQTGGMCVALAITRVGDEEGEWLDSCAGSTRRGSLRTRSTSPSS